MAQLAQPFLDSYHDLMTNKTDPRVDDWPLMSSPLPTLMIISSYVYFSKVLGPRLMESRKPMKLQCAMIAYNFVQVVYSAWLFYESLVAGWFFEYSFRCQPVDYSNNPKSLRVARYVWWYFFSKFTEFIDTAFFVLRKKNKHISNLHVVHHGVMPVNGWLATRFAPGGHVTFTSMTNTFVHIMMYSYYLLAAFGPRFQKYLWWKKYLTVLQMVQFVLVFVHTFQFLFIDCNYPKGLLWAIGLQSVLFFLLFSNFFKHAYKKDRASNQAINTATTQKERDPQQEQKGFKQMNEKPLHEQHDAPRDSYTIEPRHRVSVKGTTIN